MIDTHPSKPERLSSGMTAYLRGVVPPMTTVVMGVAAAAVSLGYVDPAVPVVLRGLALVAWLAVSWGMFKWLGSLRHVWLDGHDILVDDGERRVRIPLTEVTDIRQSRFSKTKTITLELSRSTPLGDRVRFVPHVALIPNFLDHPVARELRARRSEVLSSGELRPLEPGERSSRT
jgi:hypothetical protein